MNENGLQVWDGTVITCAKTGDIWSVERFGTPEPAHAELTPDGKVVFIVHSPENGGQEKTLH